MASVFTPEQREELKARIIGLVHRNKRMTMSQLERATGGGLAYGQTLSCGCGCLW